MTSAQRQPNPDPAVTTMLTLHELSDLTGVTVRTIRYYIQEGLLASPGHGPSTRYSLNHLNRLRCIRFLQREHLPLADIRRRLQSLGDAEVAALLPAQERTFQPSSPGASAIHYAQALLDESQAKPSGAEPKPGAAALPAKAPQPSQWERLSVHPDIEIHVRQPLSDENRRRLDALLEQARTLFQD